VFGAFLSNVGGKVRAVGSAAGFHFLNIFFGKARVCFRVSFFDSFVLFLAVLFFSVFCSGDFFLFFFVFLFEDSAANEGVGVGFSCGLFVFGFDKISRKSGDLVFAQLSPVVLSLRFVRGLC